MEVKICRQLFQIWNDSVIIDDTKTNIELVFDENKIGEHIKNCPECSTQVIDLIKKFNPISLFTKFRG